MKKESGGGEESRSRFVLVEPVEKVNRIKIAKTPHEAYCAYILARFYELHFDRAGWQQPSFIPRPVEDKRVHCSGHCPAWESGYAAPCTQIVTVTHNVTDKNKGSTNEST